MKDLFDTPELLPIEVQEILTEWEENAGFYDNCKILVEKLNAVGYTCDYDLSAEVFGLRKIEPDLIQITQGNWKLSEHESNMNEYTIVTDNMDIATVWAIDIDDDEAMANAKLMAASPMLLNACITILNNFEANLKFGTLLNKQELEAGINILKTSIKEATL